MGKAIGRKVVGLIVGCALLVGCSGTQTAVIRGTAEVEADPLVGGIPMPPPSNVSSPRGATREPGDNITGNIPPLPVESTATTPAALTQGPVPTKTPERAPPPPPAGGGAAVQPQASNAVPAVTVVGSGGVAPVEARSTPTAAPGGPEPGYEQLQLMLRERGVTAQELRTSNDGSQWTFTCTIPTEKAHERRVYEGYGTGPMGLSAIRNAIDRIDQDRKQR